MTEPPARPPRARRSGLSPPDQEVLHRLLAEAADGEAPGVAGFIARVNDWLRRRHPYSLRPLIPEGEGDPLVRWLDSREAGHCELFAGAFVLLARTAGYPARVVTGFRGGTWNAFSNSYTVRNSDAHAWAEIFDPAGGAWRRADPLGISAGSQAEQEVRGAAALAARTDRSWSARLDSLRVLWYRRVVSFDQQSQLETLQSVKKATELSGLRLRAALEASAVRIRDWLRAPWGWNRTAGLGGAAVALVLAAWIWRSARWGSGSWLRRASHPVRREAGRWLTRFEASAAGEPAELRLALQRLRYGPAASWGDPARIFRSARSWWRRRRRPRGVTAT